MPIMVKRFFAARTGIEIRHLPGLKKADSAGNCGPRNDSVLRFSLRSGECDFFQKNVRLGKSGARLPHSKGSRRAVYALPRWGAAVLRPYDSASGIPWVCIGLVACLEDGFSGVAGDGVAGGVAEANDFVPV